MHQYKRHIGDYAKKAGRLSLLQHGVYSQLMDACYDRERFPTLDEAIDWVWASTTEEIEAVQFVLRKFFELDSETGVYVQKRIAEELKDYHDFCAEQAAKGKKGGRPKKAAGKEEKPDGFSEEADGKPEPSKSPSEKSLTDNRKPITDNHRGEPDGSGRCPAQEIIDLFNSTTENLPKIRVQSDPLKKHISARWNQDEKFRSMEFWQRLFEYCDSNTFLSGRSPPRGDRTKPFQADLRWIVKPDNFAKILDGKYDDD